jgi:amylosucrase
LNYANPEVFRAMAGEMFFLANQGVEILRMDAVAFIWKQLDTPCENLPEAHTLLRAFNVVCRLAAPSVLFKSEAIVHPTRWSSTSILPNARTFADEDAAELGVNGYDHRRFLNSFYVNRFPESFARGIPFQDNPRTGDCRISGTTASLLGLEDGSSPAVARILLAHSVAFSTGGIPLLYLGDEVGQLNDYQYALEDGHGTDSRWVHRPHRPAGRYARRHDPSTPEGAVFAGLRRMISMRASTPELAGTRLLEFRANSPGVLGYQRPGGGTGILALANFSDEPQRISAATLSGFAADAVDLLAGTPVRLDEEIVLCPHGFVWLRVWPAS